MVREPVDVLRYYKLHSVFILAVDLSWNLQNLHVVAEDVWGHLVRANVDYVNIKVFSCSEDSADLGVFTLEEFFHADTFQLVNWHRVDMNLNPFSFLNVVPFQLEFFLHLFPYEQILLVQLLDFVFHSFLENVIFESPLNFSGFLHQKSKVSKSHFCLMHSPIFLDTSCGEYWPLMTLEHQAWNLDRSRDLIFVTYTVE